MDQIDIAIHQTAHDAVGGLESLARTMGIGAQVLRNKVCPTTDTHKLSLREAVAMMDASNDDRILIVLAEMRGYTLARNALPIAPSIIEAVLAADAEHGGVAQHIRSAIADGKLIESEKAAIIAQIKRATDTLDALHSTITTSPTQIKAAT